MESLKTLLSLHEISRILSDMIYPFPFFMMVEGKQKLNKNRITEMTLLAVMLSVFNWYQNSGTQKEISELKTKIESSSQTTNEAIGQINTSINSITLDANNITTRLKAVEVTLDKITVVKVKGGR